MIRLTITSNSSAFEQLKTIGTLESRDLSMGEFRQEFRFLVIGVMLIGSREFDGDTSPGGSSPDLITKITIEIYRHRN